MGPLLPALLAALGVTGSSVGTAASALGSAIGSAASTVGGAIGSAASTVGSTLGLGAEAASPGITAAAGPATSAAAPATLAPATLPGAQTAFGIAAPKTLAQAIGSLVTEGNVGPLAEKGLDAAGAPQSIQDVFKNLNFSVGPGGGGGKDDEQSSPLGAPRPIRRNTVQSVFARRGGY